MPCNSPLMGFRGVDGRFVSVRAKSPTGAPMQIPCGQCFGCRQEKQNQLALRLDHEASLYPPEEVIFGTATYAPGNLPPDGGLRPSDMSDAIRLLRQNVRRECERLGVSYKKIRFYFGGEYGDEDGRPHYHFFLFGWSFPDMQPWRVVGEEQYFRSALIERCWPHGHVEIAPVSGKASRYVCKYATKKITGSPADDHYLRPHPETGELFRVEPEGARMSNRPGIGARWIDKFECDAFPSGYLVEDGKKIGVPRYYKKRLRGRFDLAGSDASRDKVIERDDAYVMRRKSKPRTFSDVFKANNSQARREAREEKGRLSAKHGEHQRVLRAAKSRGGL